MSNWSTEGVIKSVLALADLASVDGTPPLELHTTVDSFYEAVELFTEGDGQFQAYPWTRKFYVKLWLDHQLGGDLAVIFAMMVRNHHDKGKSENPVTFVERVRSHPTADEQQLLQKFEAKNLGV